LSAKEGVVERILKGFPLYFLRNKGRQKPTMSAEFFNWFEPRKEKKGVYTLRGK
jgi:hypothetical protein